MVYQAGNCMATLVILTENHERIEAKGERL